MFARVAVVFPLKLRFGFIKVRHRGLAKNLHRLCTSFGLIDLLASQRFPVTPKQ